MDPDYLRSIIESSNETENLEFKRAETNFNFDGGKRSVMGYCVALANEGGGKLVLGVTDKLPRKVTGSQAFPNLGKLKSDVYSRIKRRIEAEEVFIDSKRIVVISIEGRPRGEALEFNGQYLMRVSEELLPMSPDQLKKIFNEDKPDFSNKDCSNISIEDLDIAAINKARDLFIKKTPSNKYAATLSNEDLLDDLGFMKNGILNNSALILLAKADIVDAHIPQSEIVFEYRDSKNEIEFKDRVNFRGPLLLELDNIWAKINLRNQITQIQEGFFKKDIPLFNEQVIRESILNAVSHRDYLDRSSVYVKQSLDEITIISPGSFLEGVTPENIVHQTKPRNRTLSEILSRIGLVERSGQGADKIFRFTIEEGRGLPDYFSSDSYRVVLNVPVQIKDKEFLSYLEKIASQKQISLSVDDLIFLENVRDSQKSIDDSRREMFLSKKIIEKVGSGRGTRYLLAKEFYAISGNQAEYTRKKWLAKSSQKELLKDFFKEHKKGRMSDFRNLFDSKLNNRQIGGILNELRNEGEIYFDGKQRSPAAYWRVKIDKE